jgi:hypothetical protein
MGYNISIMGCGLNLQVYTGYNKTAEEGGLDGLDHKAHKRLVAQSAV